MNREDIIRMAEEAGLCWQEYEGRICPDRVGAGDFEKFAQLVAAHERDEILAILDRDWFITQADVQEMIRARK